MALIYQAWATAATASVPCSSVFDASVVVSAVMGLGRVEALGFREASSSVFDASVVDSAVIQRYGIRLARRQ